MASSHNINDAKCEPEISPGTGDIQHTIVSLGGAYGLDMSGIPPEYRKAYQPNLPQFLAQVPILPSQRGINDHQGTSSYHFAGQYQAYAGAGMNPQGYPTRPFLGPRPQYSKPGTGTKFDEHPPYKPVTIANTSAVGDVSNMPPGLPPAYDTFVAEYKSPWAENSTNSPSFHNATNEHPSGGTVPVNFIKKHGIGVSDETGRDIRFTEMNQVPASNHDLTSEGFREDVRPWKDQMLKDGSRLKRKSGPKPKPFSELKVKETAKSRQPSPGPRKPYTRKISEDELKRTRGERFCHRWLPIEREWIVDWLKEWRKSHNKDYHGTVKVDWRAYFDAFNEHFTGKVFAGDPIARPERTMNAFQVFVRRDKECAALMDREATARKTYYRPKRVKLHILPSDSSSVLEHKQNKVDGEAAVQSPNGEAHLDEEGSSSEQDGEYDEEYGDFQMVDGDQNSYPSQLKCGPKIDTDPYIIQRCR